MLIYFDYVQEHTWLSSLRIFTRMHAERGEFATATHVFPGSGNREKKEKRERAYEFENTRQPSLFPGVLFCKLISL